MITAEWCKREARVCMETSLAFRGADKRAGFGDAYERTAAALTIAARVLDEGAVERLADIADAEWGTNEEGALVINMHDAARAVLAYLKGEK